MTIPKICRYLGYLILPFALAACVEEGTTYDDVEENYVIGPDDAEIRQGEEVTLGIFNDGVQDFGAYLGDDRSDFEVDHYQWTIEPQHLATLSQQEGFETQLAAKVPGTVTITASNTQRSLTKTVTLKPALLESLTISPSEGSFYSGLTRQLQAIGHYSDSSVKVLTTDVSWSHDSSGSTSISEAGVLLSSSPSQFSITASINDELNAQISHSVNFTVTEPALASISTGTQLSLALGRSSQLSALGAYTDLTSKQIAGNVSWVITGDAIVSITEEGLLQTLGEGVTTVNASLDNGYGTQITSSSMMITVEPKILESMVVSPEDTGIDAQNPIIAVDKSPIFVVTGVYSNGDRQAFTAESDSVTWSSSDTNVATVASVADSQGEYKATINTHLVGDSNIKSEALNRDGQSISAQLSISVNRPPLVSIAISWQEVEFAKGESASLFAQGAYEDGSLKDISEQVTWISANPEFLNFLNSEQVNLAKAVAAGDTSVSASLTNIEDALITSPAFSVQVVPPVIYQARIDSLTDGQLDGEKLVIAQGLENPLVFTAIYTDQTEQAFSLVSWQSSNNSLASISVGDGGVSALDVGEVVIEADVTIEGLNFKKQISVEVTPALLTSMKIELNGESGFWKGLQQTFKAVGSFSNGLDIDLTDEVTWSVLSDHESQASQITDTPNILQLNNPGSAGISATFIDQYNQSKETLVSYPFTVNAALLTSINVTAKIDAIENVTEVANGKEVKFQAFGSYTDETTLELTTEVNWLTNPEGKLQVDSNGLGTGLATSSSSDNLRVIANQTNENNDVISFELPFTVTPATLLSIRLVQVSDVFGEQIPAGASSQVNAIGYFSDKKEYPISALTWDSLDASAALVSEAGVVTTQSNVDGVPIEPGETGDSKAFFIRGIESLSGEKHSAQIKLYTAAPVVKSIRIDPDTTSAPYEIANGSELYMRAYSVYTDAHEKEITKSDVATWLLPNSSHTSFISVNNTTNFKGLVTGLTELAEGEDPLLVEVQQTNSRSQLISSTANVTVGAAQLDFIEITPARPSIVEGDSLSFTATGFLTNNTSEDFTSKVTWSSQREFVATFDATALNSVKGSSVGNSNIYASFTTEKDKTVTDSTLLTVDEKSLREISISSNITRITQDTPPRHLFLLGLTDTLKAQGLYSNDDTADLSQGVTWNSSDESVASINNSDNKGALQPLKVGTTSITAQLDIVELGVNKTISVEFLVTVGSPLLEHLEITPSSPTVTQGVRQHLTATGIYSDNSSQDLTTQVSWSTGSNSAEPEADKVGVVGSDGIFTAQKGGEIVVSARLENIDGDIITDKTFATVAELTAIDIEQSAVNVYLGQNLNLTAYGVVTGGSRVLFEEDLTWHSSDSTVALLANANGGSQNVIEAKKEGAVTLTATKTINNKPSVVGSLVLVVKPALLESISITASTSTAPKGMSWQFSAQGEYSDNSHKDVTTSITWLSLDGDVASMASGGVFKGLTQGSVNIQAKASNAQSEEIVSNIYPFTVTASTLKAINVSPATTSIPAGLTKNLLVSGTLTDNNIVASVVSPEIVFSSNNESVATVDQNGLVTTHIPGTATISVVKPGVLATSSGDVTIQDSSVITVTNPELNQLSIIGNTSLADGQTLQFTVQALKSDGSVFSPITANDVTWFSNKTEVAFINSNGLLEARSAGDARIQISKTSNSGLLVSSAVDVTVTPPVLESIVITPSTDPDFSGSQIVDYKGHNIRLKAYGIDSVSAKVVLSDGIVWNSTNSGTVLLDDQATGDEVLSELKTTGTVTITASKSVSGQPTIVGSVALNVQPALLESISISADMASAPKGLTRQYTATGEYSDNTTQDITSSVTWVSQSTSLATITSSGLITSLQVGTVNIQAKKSNAQSTEITSDSSAFEVQSPVLKAITMTPSSASTPKGLPQTFTVSGTNTDNSAVASVSSPEINWSSSSTSLATVDQQGVVTTLAMGNVTITARKSGTLYTTAGDVIVQASQVLSITAAELNSLTITGGDSSLANGQDLQFSVTGKKSDNSDFTGLTSSNVTWFSSDTSVVVISDSGLLETRSEGSADIQITKDSLSGLTISDTITVTVTAPILKTVVIKPSSDPDFSAPQVVAYKGQNISFNAHGIDTIGDTVTFTDGVTWTSSDITIALMNSALTGAQGAAELKNNDATAITVFASKAVDGSADIVGSIQLKVEAALLESIAISADISTAAKGLERQFSAQGTYSDNSVADITSTVSWLSDNETFATINAAGRLTSKSVGSLNITAKKTNVTGVEKTSPALSFEVLASVLKAIAISPSTASVPLGLTQSYSVSGTNTDDSAVASVTSPEISFTSSDETVATVDSDGLVTTIKAGATTITASKAGVLATVDGDVTILSSSALTVIAPELKTLAIVEGDSSTAKGQSLQFSISGTKTDGTDFTGLTATDVTWSSATTSVATISASGVLKAEGTGECIITISKNSLSGAVISTNVTVTVGAAVLKAIVIAPNTPSVPSGLTQAFTVSGTNTDDSAVASVTSPEISFTSSDETVATVDSDGLVTTVKAGTSTITASKAGVLTTLTGDVTITSSATLTVTAAELASLGIAQGNSSVAKGNDLQLAITGLNTDGTNFTPLALADVTWSSSNPGVVTVSDSGLLQTLTVGTSTIQITKDSATQGSIATSIVVTVTPAVLKTIVITSATSSVYVSNSAQFSAKGIYTDNTEVNPLTDQFSWAVSESSLADIDSNGLVTSKAEGTVTVSATPTDNTVAVTTASLTVAAVPANITLEVTDSGTMAEGNSVTVSAQGIAASNFTWASSTSNAVVDETGSVTGLSVGSANITATLKLNSGTPPVGSTAVTVTVAEISDVAIYIHSAPVLAKGTSLKVSPLAIYTNHTTAPYTGSVTWTTATGSVINVNGGVATGGVSATSSVVLSSAAAETATSITASPGGSLSDKTLAVTFLDTTIDALELLALQNIVADNTSLPLTATAVFADSTVQNAVVTLSSDGSAPNASTFSNSVVTLQDVVDAGVTEIFEATSTLDATKKASVSVDIKNTSTVTAGVSGDLDLVAIEVSPRNPSVAQGLEQSFKALATFEYDNSGSKEYVVMDVTAAATWSSDIDGAQSNGDITFTTSGGNVITATYDSKTATSTASVQTSIASISLSSDYSNIPKRVGNLIYQELVKASAVFSDGTSQDISEQVLWSVDNSMASISNLEGERGLLSAETTTGDFVVTAKLLASQGFMSATKDMSVDDCTLSTVSITPVSNNVGNDMSVQYQATGVFDACDDRDITDEVTWSLNKTSGEVSNAPDNKGRFYSQSTGVIGDLTATMPHAAMSGTASLTRANVSMASLEITSSVSSIAVNASDQFTVKGIYNQYSIDMTGEVVWFSSDTSKVVISNAPGNKGKATRIATGDVIITAKYKGLTITVTGVTQ